MDPIIAMKLTLKLPFNGILIAQPVHKSHIRVHYGRGKYGMDTTMWWL